MRALETCPACGVEEDVDRRVNKKKRNSCTLFPRCIPSFQVGGVYLGLLNLVVVPLLLVPLSDWLADRTGLLFYALIALSAVFFVEYGMGTAPYAVLYAVGSPVLLFGAQAAKGFVWSMVSKLPAPAQREAVMSANSMFYMFGRGTGALLSPALDRGSAFAVAVAGLNGAMVLLVLIAWRLLAAPAPEPPPPPAREEGPAQPLQVTEAKVPGEEVGLMSVESEPSRTSVADLPGDVAASH